jgi:PAS domain S-box-containing protein
MEQTHRLLKRQLERCFGDQFSIPREWQCFVDAVNDAYREFDVDREMLERSLELSSQELLQANSELRAIFRAIPDLIFRLDSQGTILNYEAGNTTHFFIQPEDMIGKRIQDIPLWGVGEKFRQAIRQVQESKAIVSIEYALARQEQKLFCEARLLPLLEDQIIVIVQDITDRKQVEQRRIADLWLWENREKIERVIRQATKVEQMLNDVVATVFSTFECDRAWLLYPCDPDAPSFEVPVEHCRPEYPGAHVKNLAVPMEPGSAGVLDAALASEGAVTFGPGTGRPIYASLATDFSVQSQMVIAVHPKVGKPWAFGMHQCSYARQWTKQERTLFEEIGRRLADALSSTLFLRDLRESEERYRNLVNTISDLVYTVDIEGNILFANPAAKQFTGYEPEEAIGHSFAEYVHPDDVLVLLTGVQQALSGAPIESIKGLGQNQSIEHRMIKEDGEVIWVASKGAPIKDDQGEIVGFTGVSRNITEQVQAEEQLRRLKEFNESIVQNMAEGIVLQDAQGYITFVNPAAAALLGHAPEEIVGLHGMAIVPPDQHPIVEAADERRARGESDRYELDLAHKDGRRTTVLVSGSPRFEERRFAGTIAVFADITERKRAEEGQREALAEALQATRALRESEARLRVLIDHLPAEVWAMDNSLHFVLQNAASARIIGNVVGKRIEYLDVPTKVKAEWLEQDRQVLDGNTLHEEYQIKVDGEQKAYENIVAPVKVGDTVVGLVGVALDVTKRKRAEEELEKHREHLEELVKERTAELVVAKDAAEEARRLAEAANQAKSAFLAKMSHELRTPLNAILGYTQILRRRPSTGLDVIDGLNVVQRSGEHLLTLINDVLDLSKIEAGRLELHPAPIHFPNFLEHIAGIIHSQAQAKRLTFNFIHPEGGLPTWVEADETRLRQVLFNLLDNAIKFTDEGQVILRVKCEFTPHVSRFTFHVEDTGVGIPFDQLERIFLPFEQVEEVLHHTEGTGLGLAISRQLVRLMGGELHVASPLSAPSIGRNEKGAGGPGSIFWFEIVLPVTEMAMEDVQPPEQTIAGHRGSRRTVLVVDDVPLNREMLVPPSEEEMEILLDLARRGDMRAIREQTTHIETLGEQYVPFAHRLRELAKGFEEKQIRALIEWYMEKDQ